MATSRITYRGATTANDLAVRTGVGVLVAVLAALAIVGIADALALDVGPTGADGPFAAVPVVATLVVAGTGAAVAYAALGRWTARPARNFLAVAAVAFAVLLVPVAAFAPTLDVTPVGQLVLVALHVVAAVPIVAFVLGVGR